MKPENLRELDRFWAYELGITTGLANTARIAFVAQSLYPGVQLFRNTEKVIIACPLMKLESLRRAAAGISAEELFSVAWLQRTLGDEAEKILGPADLNYADETNFRLPNRDDTRPLSQADSEAYRKLAAVLDPKEVEDSGFSPSAFPAFGAFSEGFLCSAASYKAWEPSIAHITIATHPNYRRRGFAKAAVGALARAAFDHGLILQWRALASNTASLALARELGFEYYGSTIFVRLRNP